MEQNAAFAAKEGVTNGSRTKGERIYLYDGTSEGV